MSWEIHFDEQSRIIFITAMGQISNEDARAQTSESAMLMKKHNTNLVLADYSEGQSDISLANLYWLVDFYRQVDAPTDMRAGVILPRSGHRIEAYQFHTLAARNAGYNVRLFEKREDALKWLLESRRPGETNPPE